MSTGDQGKKRYAEWFIQRGFAIFPIDTATKKPVVLQWQRYSTTPLTDEEKIRYLEMIEKGHNYAVPGGQLGLVILDVEDLAVLKEWIGEQAINNVCSKTLCVTTPHGGLHIYLQSKEIPSHKFNPAFTRNNKTVMDLQSFNSYVVGVGSCLNHKHCTVDKCQWRGQDYTSCYTLYGKEMEIGEYENLKELLKFLSEKGEMIGIQTPNNVRAWFSGESGEQVKETGKERDLESLKKEMETYDRFKGKTVDAIRGEVCLEMKKDNDALKERTDHESEKWKAIYRVAIPVVCEGKTYTDIGLDRSRGDWNVMRALFSHGVTNLDVVYQLLPPNAKVFAPKWDEYAVHTIEKAWRLSKPSVRYQKEARGKSEKEVKKIARKIITDAILERYRIRTFYQSKGNKQYEVGIFAWQRQKGIYAPFDKTIRKIVRKIAETLEIRSRDKKTLTRLSKKDVDDIVDEIKDLTLKPLPRDPLRIAFKNVTLEWGQDGPTWIFKRTPKKYAFYYLPWEVNVDAITKMSGFSQQEIEELAKRLCPRALETFKQWVDDKWILLFEIIGYTFYPGYKFRKAFMILGSGRNGKSTYINLVKRILGDYAISISPRELFDTQQRFVAGQMYHRLANAVSESKDYSIDDMDRVKRLTGDDWITADVKFKDPITFKNVAKVIIASNNMPRIRDTSDKAFWHRWVILEFPHQFSDNDSWFEGTFSESEINGIVTVSIVAIMRAFLLGRFDFEQTEEEVMDLWLSRTDSVYSFVKEYVAKGILELNPKNGDLFVSKTKLHNMYYGYCSDNGYRGVDERNISKLLRRYFNVTVSRKTMKLKDRQTGQLKEARVRCYVGIGINNAQEELEDIVTINERNEFLEYLQKHNNPVVKDFGELVQDFGGNSTKAMKFLEWCSRRNMCTQKGIDRWEIKS